MRLFFLIVVAVQFCACQLFSPEYAPYSLSEVTVSNGVDGDQKIATLSFNICNEGDLEMDSFDLEFDVYDTEDSPQPSIGSNHVESTITMLLTSGDSAEAEVSLDPLFHIAPVNPLTVSRLIITNIYYSNGSVWSDDFKQFYVMTVSVTVDS